MVIVLGATLFVFPPVFLFTMIMALVKKTKGWIAAAVATGIIVMILILLIVIGGGFLVYMEAPVARGP